MRNQLPIRRLAVAVALVALAAPHPARSHDVAAPPPTRVEVVRDTLHGVVIEDPYRWLEDQDDPEVRVWIAAQQRYTRAFLDGIPGRDDLRARLEPFYQLDSANPPIERSGRYFYTKRRADQDLSVLYLRRSHGAADEVLLDPHAWSADHRTSLSLLDVSIDGGLVAYGIRRGGADEVGVRILDVDGRHDLADSLARARYSSIALEPRRGGLYYSKFTPDQGPRAYHHVMGTDPARDPMIFGEGLTPDQILGVTLSDDGRWALFVVYHGSAGRNDVYLQNVAEHGPVVTVVEGVDATFDVQFAGDRLAIKTDWEAPNGRVFVAELANPGREHWKEIVPASATVIEQMVPAGGKLFLRTLHQVVQRLEVYDLNGKPAGEVRFPGIGTVSSLQGYWDGHELFFNFESYNVPRTIYRCQIASGRRSEWWRSKAPVRSDDYVVKQVWYPSKDGTRVPMFVMHRKGLKLDGLRPTLLYGYGGFQQNTLPAFKPMALVLAEMGGVYASANLRGGSELGEAWHKAGMLEHKQNTFDDFAAACEWLIANRYTSSAKLAVQGGSNGGLLVGALLTQRPELASVVLCGVPLLDMLRYDRFLVARFWVPEYGTAENPAQFPFIHAYSPYHHVKQGEKYPATMIISGDLDTRVAPLHARKMTALLQAATGSGQPVVLHYDTEFGHMGGKPIRLVVEDVTDQMLFMLHGLGVPVESQGARIGSTAASPSQP